MKVKLDRAAQVAKVENRLKEIKVRIEQSRHGICIGDFEGYLETLDTLLMEVKEPHSLLKQICLSANNLDKEFQKKLLSTMREELERMLLIEESPASSERLVYTLSKNVYSVFRDTWNQGQELAPKTSFEKSVRSFLETIDRILRDINDSNKNISSIPQLMKKYNDLLDQAPTAVKLAVKLLPNIPTTAPFTLPVISPSSLLETKNPIRKKKNRKKPIVTIGDGEDFEGSKKQHKALSQAINELTQSIGTLFKESKEKDHLESKDEVIQKQRARIQNILAKELPSIKRTFLEPINNTRFLLSTLHAGNSQLSPQDIEKKKQLEAEYRKKYKFSERTLYELLIKQDRDYERQLQSVFEKLKEARSIISRREEKIKALQVAQDSLTGLKKSYVGTCRAIKPIKESIDETIGQISSDEPSQALSSQLITAYNTKVAYYTRIIAKVDRKITSKLPLDLELKIQDVEKRKESLRQATTLLTGTQDALTGISTGLKVIPKTVEAQGTLIHLSTQRLNGVIEDITKRVKAIEDSSRRYVPYITIDKTRLKSLEESTKQVIRAFPSQSKENIAKSATEKFNELNGYLNSIIARQMQADDYIQKKQDIKSRLTALKSYATPPLDAFEGLEAKHTAFDEQLELLGRSYKQNPRDSFTKLNKIDEEVKTLETTYTRLKGVYERREKLDIIKGLDGLLKRIEIHKKKFEVGSIPHTILNDISQGLLKDRKDFVHSKLKTIGDLYQQCAKTLTDTAPSNKLHELTNKAPGAGKAETFFRCLAEIVHTFIDQFCHLDEKSTSKHRTQFFPSQTEKHVTRNLVSFLDTLERAAQERPSSQLGAVSIN